MFISKFAPILVSTGEILSPEAINENNNYFRKAFVFEADKQTARWTTSFSLNPTVSTSLTSAVANLDMLLTRRIPPNNFRVMGTTGGSGGSSKLAAVYIESVSVTIYYTATTAFELAIRPFSSSSDERIEFPIRSSALATEPYNVVKLMNLTHNDTRDLFRVRNVGGTTATLPAGVTITKFDVIVGFASDKYISGNKTDTVLTKPTLSIPTFNDASTADASVFSSLKTTLETAATNAKNGFPFRWCAVDFFDLNDSSDIRIRSKPILPAWRDAAFVPFTTYPTQLNNNANIIGVWIDADCSVVTSGFISFGLADNTGTLVPNLNVNVAVAANASGGVIGSTQLRYEAADLAANDRYISISVPAGNTIRRCTAYLLLQ